MKIHLYKKKDGSVRNIIHTRYGVYQIDSLDGQPVKLSENDYSISDYGHIDNVNAFDEYFFTSLGHNIYYWNTEEQKIKVLEGTFDPDEWQPNHSYSVGDMVKPSDSYPAEDYPGLIYKCTYAGTSGTTEPEWSKDMVTEVADNTTTWVACGSIELEGQSGDNVTLKAQCVELFKGFLFVANTIEGNMECPTRLRWSQYQNPRLWHNNEDGSGLAGYVDVDDTDGRIMALKRIGDVLYVYKENSIIALTYTGDSDTVFSKEVVTTKAGLIAPEAIVELPHMNIFIGEDDIYVFDGNTCTGIGESINKWFFTKFLNKALVERVFGFYDEKNQEVIFCFNKVEDGAENEYIYNDDGAENSSDSNEESEEESEEETVPAPDQSDDSLLRNNKYGLVFNIKLRTWSLREVDITAIGKLRLIKDNEIDQVESQIQHNNYIIDAPIYSGSRMYNVAGDKDGNLYIVGGYSDLRYVDDEGEPKGYEGYVITKTHHMEEPGKIKRLMRIQFHIETIPKQYDTNGNETQGYGLYCQVGTAWSPETVNDDDVTWSEKKYINLKRPTASYAQHHIIPYIDVDLTARYFRLRFGTEGNDTYFKILGYTLYYQVRGDE